MPTPRIRLAYSIVSVIIAVLLSSGFAIWYTGYQNAQWCEALSIFTQRDPRTLPAPTTAAGIEQRKEQIKSYEALVRLRGKFHC